MARDRQRQSPDTNPQAMASIDAGRVLAHRLQAVCQGAIQPRQKAVAIPERKTIQKGEKVRVALRRSHNRGRRPRRGCLSSSTPDVLARSVGKRGERCALAVRDRRALPCELVQDGAGGGRSRCHPLAIHPMESGVALFVPSAGANTRFSCRGSRPPRAVNAVTGVRSRALGRRACVSGGGCGGSVHPISRRLMDAWRRGGTASGGESALRNPSRQWRCVFLPPEGVPDDDEEEEDESKRRKGQRDVPSRDAPPDGDDCDVSERYDTWKARARR
eukprot:ctg_1797.g532